MNPCSSLASGCAGRSRAGCGSMRGATMDWSATGCRRHRTHQPEGQLSGACALLALSAPQGVPHMFAPFRSTVVVVFGIVASLGVLGCQALGPAGELPAGAP